MILFWLAVTSLIFGALICITWPFLPMLIQGKREAVNVKFILLLCLWVLGLALLLYNHWGFYNQLTEYQQQQKNRHVVEAELQKMGSPEQVIEKLAQKLQEHPDAKGFYLLGRLYLSQGLFAPAEAALAQANQLKPNDKTIMLQYVEAQFLAQHQLSEQARALLEKVLVQDPNNAEAANMLAIAAFQHGDYQQAIERWELLLNRFPAESEDGKKLLEAIAKAQTALKQTGSTNSVIQIPVKVTLGDQAKSHVASGDTIFIYAQAAEGPKMPLAIIRKQVKNLPLAVTLNETMSMIPGMTLDKFAKVRIIARATKFGQAIPQPGDWVGETAVFDVKHVPAELTITIDKPLAKDTNSGDK